MLNFTPEKIVFLVGILGVLAGLEKLTDLKARPKWALSLFVLGLAVQASTQFLQYSNVVQVRTTLERAEDREVAFALHALSETDLNLLKNVAPDHPYVFGYVLFKNGDLEGAEEYFRRSLEKHSFEVSSHYMLAYLILNDPRKEWKDAVEHLRKAIELDRDYAPAYYLEALTKVRGGNVPGALDELRESVKRGIGPCRDLNNPSEVAKLWKDLAGLPEFQKIQHQCLAYYEVPKLRSE